MHSTRHTVNRWKIALFLAKRVPSVLFAGIKPHSISKTQCGVTIQRNWRNRNPNNSVYFPNIIAAGEMATGLMLFDDILNAGKEGYKLAAAVTAVSATFYRPVDDKGALVVCRQGLELSAVVERAKTHRMAKYTTTSYVLDPSDLNGKPLGTVEISWVVVRHRKPKV